MNNSIDVNIIVDEYQNELNRLTKEVIVLKAMLKQANIKLEELQSENENKKGK